MFRFVISSELLSNEWMPQKFSKRKRKGKSKGTREKEREELVKQIEYCWFDGAGVTSGLRMVQAELGKDGMRRHGNVQTLAAATGRQWSEW